MLNEQAHNAAGAPSMISEEPAPRHRLYRSRRDRMLAGVAGGLAHYFGIDPVLVRLGFVLLTVTTGAGLPAYIILAIVTPEYPAESTEPESAALGLDPDRGRQFGGYFLLVLGLVFLAANFGWFNFIHWGRIWPVFLVLAGIFLLLNRRGESAA